MGRPEKKLPPAAHAFLAAHDAYLAAPRDERDQGLVRELCDHALEELVAPTSPKAPSTNAPST